MGIWQMPTPMAMAHNSTTPMGLNTGPAMMPSALGLVRFWIAAVSMTTPVLASNANSGRMTKATGLCSRCSSRCEGDFSSSERAEKWNGKCQKHACQRGAHAGFQHQRPYDEAPIRCGVSVIQRSKRLNAINTANTPSAPNKYGSESCLL